MIVVVIIGALAALATPAVVRVRNTAVEKLLFNDARQISSACNQWYIENATDSVMMDRLSGATGLLKSLSSGVIVIEGKQVSRVANPVQTSFSTIRLSGSGHSLVPTSRIFALCHTGYTAGISRDVRIASNYDAKSNVLNFAVDTGEVLSKDGCRWATPTVLYSTPVDGDDQR